MNGAQALIESLLREGVTHMFGYAGATICPAVDALKEHPEIAYTLVRTEQNAGHMASGYARISGKVGVCMVTSGPGATNLITGIATAYMDSIPMVAITGQVPSHLLGRDIFQEVDITGAVAPFSKHSYLVKNANDIPRIVKEAFHIASTGRPGPVLIDIPIDVQEQHLKSFRYPEQVDIRGYKPSVKGNDLQIKRVVDAIARSRQPLICAGGGVWLADARAELLELAESCAIPVVKTMMGIGLMPTDHPLNMGMVGAHGNHCANQALARADLLIMVGTRAADRAMVDPREIQRRMATIHIDVDPAEIGKNMQAAVPLVGDVKVILRQILERGAPVTDSAAWLEQMKDYRRAELQRAFPRREGYVFPGTVMRRLGRKLKEDAVVCVDVGQNQLFACKYLPQKQGRLLTSGGLGTMGFGYGAAIGAQMALGRDQRVIMLTGDGSFHMNLNEGCTAVSYHLPIITIIFNNQVLGMVRQWQTSFYEGRYSSTDPHRQTDFVKLAEGFGAKGYRATTPAEFREALADAMKQDGPSWIDCRIGKDERVLPMIPGGGDINDIIME